MSWDGCPANSFTGLHVPTKDDPARCRRCGARRPARDVREHTTFVPSSHNTDPLSSHEAEALMTETGTRQTNCRRVLEALIPRPGAVASELVEPTGLDVVEVRRRLDDLHKLHTARQGDVKRRVGHTAEITWYAVQGRD